LNILLITSCEFFELGHDFDFDFDDDGLDGLFDGFAGTKDYSLTLGLYKFSITGGSDCKENVSEFQDAYLNCGKVCAVIALILGLIIVLAAIIKQCLFKLPAAQKLLDVASILTQIFLALVYVTWGYVRVRNLSRKLSHFECF
jgi:hypothetical protein